MMHNCMNIWCFTLTIYFVNGDKSAETFCRLVKLTSEILNVKGNIIFEVPVL